MGFDGWELKNELRFKDPLLNQVEQSEINQTGIYALLL
jgi:hypothetical protein